jgi:hypothetical protein
VTEHDGISPESEKQTSELDDVADRDELRKRYDMLLQELRVTLPGVQVLTAFLLTAPFSQRFGELDLWGRRAYGAALASSMISVIFLLAPAVLHRLGERRARSARLRWSIRLMLAGLFLLGLALVSAMWSVARFVFGTGTAWWLTGPMIVLIVSVWIVLPFTLRRNTATTPGDR